MEDSLPKQDEPQGIYKLSDEELDTLKKKATEAKDCAYCKLASLSHLLEYIRIVYKSFLDISALFPRRQSSKLLRTV